MRGLIDLSVEDQAELREVASLLMDGKGNLYPLNEETRRDANEIRAGLTLLDVIEGWGDFQDVRVSPLLVLAPAIYGRLYAQQCLTDDEAGFERGLADPSSRGMDQSAEEFREQMQTGFAQRRESLAVLDALLTRIWDGLIA